ncbi:hypothetical protein Clacol_003964 [Clathrus columnatus]|uniref:Uncharacterized protein n=1 Tax=Clathrus columnatus TaxID=1419009 RepID=A0AAV5AA04_9AGAM|nr:hypothetical protein Clacol_003964 [Clathrus columnatus]
MASNATYTLCLRIKLVRPHSGALSDLEAQYTTPGGARAEAERRRALALKALDQRLANPAQNPGATSSTPSRQHTASPTLHGPNISTSSSSSSRAQSEGEADLGAPPEK